MFPGCSGYLGRAGRALIDEDVYRGNDVTMAVDHGLRRVRFVSAVPVGSRVRARIEPQNVVDEPHGTQATVP